MTTVPTGPEEGEKEVITGAWAIDCKILKTTKEKRSRFLFATRDLKKYDS